MFAWPWLRKATLTVSHWTAVQSRLVNVPQTLRCSSAAFIDLTPNYKKPKFGSSARALGILWIAGKLLEIAVINWRIGRSQLVVALPVAFILMDTSRQNMHFWHWKLSSEATHFCILCFLTHFLSVRIHHFRSSILITVVSIFFATLACSA